MLPHRQTAELVVGAGLAAGMTMFYIAYTGRTIGAAEYSDFSVALSVIYLVGLTLSPMTPTVARLMAQYHSRGDGDAANAVHRRAFRAVGLAGSVATAAGVGSASLIARLLHFRSASPLVLSFLAVLMVALIGVDRGAVQGLHRFRIYNGNILLESALRLGTALVMLRVSRSAAAPLVGYVVALVVAEVALRRHTAAAVNRMESRAVDWSEVRQIGVPLVVLMLAVALMQNADMLAVKRWFTAEESGLYGAASLIARTFGVIFTPLYAIAGPVMTTAYEERRSVIPVTLRLCAWFIALSIPAMIVFSLWPAFVSGILFGAGFKDAAPLLAPLGGVSVIGYTALMMSQALITMRARHLLTVYAGSAIVCVGGLLLLHATIAQIIGVLYVSQGLLLAAVVALIVLPRPGAILARR